MEPSKIIALSAAVALAIGAGVALTQDDVAHEAPAAATVTWRDDGTKVYHVPVVLKDGTPAVKETTEAPCKRRPRGGRDCFRTHALFDGKEVTDEAPELGRFPAETMTGAGCEPVACSVMLGDDAEAEEKPPVQR